MFCSGDPTLSEHADEALTGFGDPWESMIGWLDNEPVDDIDDVIYGHKA